MKLIKYLIPVILAGSLTYGALAADIVVRPIETEQAINKVATGKYRAYAKDEWKKDTRVYEYELDGQVGYRVLEYELRADGTYMRAFGEGPDTSQYFDWIKISDFATSTP
jgi:hypothetical protein